MPDHEAFKRASIDWLLSVGDCEQMDASTMTALKTLRERGVDYERSEKPEFQATLVGGDSFTQASEIKAFSARIVPVGADEFRDSFRFYVSESDVQNLILGYVIRAVTSESTQDGEAPAWQRKVDEYEENMRRWRDQHGS